MKKRDGHANAEGELIGSLFPRMESVGKCPTTAWGIKDS